MTEFSAFGSWCALHSSAQCSPDFNSLLKSFKLSLPDQRQIAFYRPVLASPPPPPGPLDIEWPIVQNDFLLTFAGLLCNKLEVFFPRSRLKAVFEEAERSLLAKCAGFMHTYLPKSSKNFTSRSSRSLLRTSGASFLSKHFDNMSFSMTYTLPLNFIYIYIYMHKEWESVL